MAQAFGQLTAETGAQADTDINHLSLDGKTLRGSKDADGKAEHVLPAFCVALDQSVSHVSSRGKGMEIPDALRLIDQLDLTDKIVTGDALFCQKTITSKVLGKGGDHALPVKGNRKAQFTNCLHGRAMAVARQGRGEAFSSSSRWNHRR